MTDLAADADDAADPAARSSADYAAAALTAAVGVGVMVAAIWSLASAPALAERLGDPLAPSAALAWSIRLAGVGAGSAAQALFLTAVASVAGRSRGGDALRWVAAAVSTVALLSATALWLTSK